MSVTEMADTHVGLSCGLAGGLESLIIFACAFKIYQCRSSTNDKVKCVKIRY